MFASAHAAVAGQAPQAGAENGGRPTIVATCLADGESIALDGRLDEPVWSRAVPGGDFMQVDPDNGRPATEKTEDRMTIGTIKVSPAWRARFLASSVFTLRGSGDRDNALVERTRAALNS